MSRRTTPTVLVLLLSLLATSGLSVSASASTFLAMSERQLVRQADAIVEARVVGLESFWSEGGRLIVTEATLAVEEVIAGDAPSVLTVRTFGGTVGDVRVEASGFPRFEQNERVVLFVKAEPADGSNRVLGYQQGHFRVVERLDGVTLAVPMVEDARLLTPSGRLAPEPRSVELGAFKSALRRAAARERGLAR